MHENYLENVMTYYWNREILILFNLIICIMCDINNGYNENKFNGMFLFGQYFSMKIRLWELY